MARIPAAPEGLADLLTENASLGDALRSLVDTLDVSSDTGRGISTGEAAAKRSLEWCVPSPPALSPGRGGVPSPPATNDTPGRGGGFIETALPTQRNDARMDSDLADLTDTGHGEATDNECVVLQAAPTGIPVASGEAPEPVSDLSISSVSSVAPLDAVDVSASFVAAAEEIAALVTVSPELRRGEAGEIRVQLRPDVLEGSEVVIAVDGKKMDVLFVPTVTHVADTLVNNQQILQQHLVARVSGFEISVAVAQTVATNVIAGVGASQAVQAATNRYWRTHGRT